MIVTWFNSREPLRIRAPGPITQNGPISTSSSISADESIEAFSAMRDVITDFSSYCQRFGQDKLIVSLWVPWPLLGVLMLLAEFRCLRRAVGMPPGDVLRRTPPRRRFKTLIRHFNLFQQPPGQLCVEMMPAAVTNHVP